MLEDTACLYTMYRREILQAILNSKTTHFMKIGLPVDSQGQILINLTQII